MRLTCGVPEELNYQTKPEIAFERGEMPCQWVAADELYGDSSSFRDGVAGLDKWYFMEVSCSSHF